jgi:hypothetical protein
MFHDILGTRNLGFDAFQASRMGGIQVALHLSGKRINRDFAQIRRAGGINSES